MIYANTQYYRQLRKSGVITKDNTADSPIILSTPYHLFDYGDYHDKIVSITSTEGPMTFAKWQELNK